MNRKMMPYLFVNMLAFYLLPMVIRDTGTAMAVMLVVIPLICVTVAIVYEAKNGFTWLYSTVVALLFAPTIFVFYNYTAWVYVIGYGLLALAGNVIGKLFYTGVK